MNAGLDTSVVLRLLTGTPEHLAQCALHEVQRRIDAGGKLLVSDLVVTEVYFALQHHYGMPKHEALTLLAGFLRHKGIETIGTVVAVLATPNLATANPGFVDRLIHAEYCNHTSEILTFEKAAGRLPGVRVLK